MTCELDSSPVQHVCVLAGVVSLETADMLRLQDPWDWMPTKFDPGSVHHPWPVRVNGVFVTFRVTGSKTDVGWVTHDCLQCSGDGVRGCVWGFHAYCLQCLQSGCL